MRGRLPVVAAQAALAVGALGSCTTTSSALPPTPPTVSVTMEDYRFVFDNDVSRGRVVFRADNAGKLDHEMQLIVIPDSFPLTITQQVRSDVRQAFATKAVLPGRAPGVGGEFAVDLAAGRYALTCFLKDPDGKSHAVKGMAAEFRVE